jgi:hypothetical protein
MVVWSKNSSNPLSQRRVAARPRPGIPSTSNTALGMTIVMYKALWPKTTHKGKRTRHHTKWRFHLEAIAVFLDAEEIEMET